MSDSLGLGRGPRTYIYIKFPDNADTAGLTTTLRTMVYPVAKSRGFVPCLTLDDKRYGVMSQVHWLIRGGWWVDGGGGGHSRRGEEPLRQFLAQAWRGGCLKLAGNIPIVTPVALLRITVMSAVECDCW